MTNKNDTQVYSPVKNLTPREIVSELDRYVIGQNDAKRSVAIALRNRWRRLNVNAEMREEITPKNIIMIGSTGVGKTEIARRLAKLANAPFIKVEASKFTEVGYVGKDVESMIRDLTEMAVKMVKENEQERVKTKGAQNAEEKLLDILLPDSKPKEKKMGFDFSTDETSSDVYSETVQEVAKSESEKSSASKKSTREKFREKLRKGELDERKVELDISPKSAGGFGGGFPMIEVVSTGASLDDLSNNLKDMFGGMMGGGNSKKKRKVTVKEALEILTEEEAAKLIDMDDVAKKAVDLTENNGIIFIDEIDKIASGSSAGGKGPDVSREGVQRDILPIIEGSNVKTKYGFVKTDHILFIAAGAFHISKPSDLIPELQGRFPIRVELSSLSEGDFYKILTEPRNSLTKQYLALMKTEDVDLNITDDALKEIAKLAAFVNQENENIGARRLHTILEKVMDELSFNATELNEKEFKIDSDYVTNCLRDVVQNQDLSRFIL